MLYGISNYYQTIKTGNAYNKVQASSRFMCNTLPLITGSDKPTSTRKNISLPLKKLFSDNCYSIIQLFNDNKTSALNGELSGLVLKILYRWQHASPVQANKWAWHTHLTMWCLFT